MWKVVLAVLCLAGCAGDPLPLTACTAGVQTACVCPGGATGAQRCAADGSAFGACECPDASSTTDVQQLADVVDVLERDVVDASSPADVSDVVDTGPRCGAGLTMCGGACAALQTDVNNCGTCGHVCPLPPAAATAACAAGQCTVGTCGPGFTVCSGVCVGLEGDTHNCGSCGHVCTTTLPHAVPLCRTTCSFTCQTGWYNCNAMAADGCEHEGPICP